MALAPLQEPTPWSVVQSQAHFSKFGQRSTDNFSVARQPPSTATISSNRISIGAVIHPSSDSPCQVVCQQHDQIALCRLQKSAIRSGSALDGGENDILGESVTRELSRNGFGEN